MPPSNQEDAPPLDAYFPTRPWYSRFSIREPFLLTPSPLRGEGGGEGQTPRGEGRGEGLRRLYHARLIRAGPIRQMGGDDSPFYIPPDTLRRTAHLFAAKPMFVDHAGWLEYPSLRDLAATTLTDVVYSEEDQGIHATIRLYDTPAGNIIAALFDQLLADAANDHAIPDIGLSAVLWPTWTPVAPASDDQSPSPPGGEGRGEGWIMADIRHVESIDFVFEPAADGRVQAAMHRLAALPDLLGYPPSFRLPGDAGGRQGRLRPPATFASLTSDLLTTKGDSPMSDITQPSPDAWLTALSRTVAETMIRNSGLPQPAQAQLLSQSYSSPDQVQAAIDAHRALVAELNAQHVVQIGSTPPRSSGITLGRTSLEQVEAALEALFNGVKPPPGVAPLSGIRELYHLLSGDYEMHGIFHPDRITLANVTSSTMANLTANVLNKAVINEFMQYPRWWEPIVTIEDFTTLQAVRWITLGGVGELPTVAEGAAYTEMTWDDSYETASFVKKGGYLGITLEAIDKDDTRRIQRAPRALAQAAWLTLGKAISEIFTANSGTGPTLSDGVALFAAGHSNLGTSALTWSAYTATRIAMMKQTEVNSSERLGFLTAPRYLLVPVDLEITALQILASEGEPGTADNDVNPYAEGNTLSARMQAARNRVVVVPHWTDTNDWAAVADPQLYPSIGLGFRYGRTPEIFSVASPTAGLMFTNDTLPVKVRFFFAVGPTDYRGLYKHNVA